jgi:hypothetical protein
LLLVVGQVQTAAIKALSGNPLTLAEAKNNDVSSPRPAHRGCDVFAVIEFDPRLWHHLVEAIQQTEMQPVFFFLVVAVSSDVGIGSDSAGIDRLRP